MANDITLFNGKNTLPAYLQDAFGDEETNLVVAESVPTLTFRGKQFRIKIGGEEHLITRTVEGETFPVPSIQVIVLDLNPNRSRTFFEGAYVSGENRSPDCWSNDGKVPDPTVASPCAKTCAACPNSVKGSRITDNGKEATACTTNRKLAVVPANKLDMEPLLLKVPQTSMWDKDNKENEAEGFYAWDQYVAFLRGRGVPHTAAVITKIKFDNTEYPKLLFGAVKWVPDSDMAKVKELVHSQQVADIIHKAETLAQSDVPETPVPDDGEVAIEEEVEEVVAKPAAKPAAKPKTAAKPKPAAKPAPVVEDDGDDSWGEEPAKPAAKPAAKAATKPAAKAAKAKPAEKPLPAEVDDEIDGLADLAASWDDVED